MDKNTGDKTDGLVITNGDVPITNGVIDVSEPKSKLVEFDCQSADITNDSSQIQKFSSKLKENIGLVNGKSFSEKDYEESAQKSMQEKRGNTELGCSSNLQLAEKERVSKTNDGGIKAEYTVGSDEQYKSKASSVNKVGDANIETSRSSDSRYSKACAKIEEQLPGNSEAEAGRRVTEASKGDFSHIEHISSSIEGPGGYCKSQGNLEEHSSDQQSQTTVTTPSGSSLQSTSKKKLTSKKESFKMECSSSASQLEEASAAGETAIGDLGRPGEIKLSTKISSDDGDQLGNATASSFAKQDTVSAISKFEQVSSSQKESTGASSSALYSRQQPDVTTSDNMSVSSMSSAHDQNEIKMSSAPSAECTYSALKVDSRENDNSKDKTYNRKSTNSPVKRILGESGADRKSKYKINMGAEGEGDEINADKDSLLQRRLASLDKADKRAGDLYIAEEYEHEEMTYSRRPRGRMNKQGSGDLDSPRAQKLGRHGSWGSFEYDDEYEGYGGGYRGRGRYSRQNYIDDEDMFGPPMPPFQPLFRDEEFEPEKRAETEEYVKEKTASIRGMVDRQTVVLENLRKASESFDELTDEIKNIRQAFIENQARRSMMFRNHELPADDELPHDQSRGVQKARSRYVQQREEDYDYAMRDAKGRKSQYDAEDYGYEQPTPALRGRQKHYSLEGEKDDYALSPYASRSMNKDLSNKGCRSLGAKDDYELTSYGRSRAIDKNSADYPPKSIAGQVLKKSYYSQEDYTTSYSVGADVYNRRLRELGGRSKSLYDEPSGGENDGYSLEDGGSRHGKMGLQRTLHHPLSDTITTKDRYGMAAYGSGGTGAGYTRVGDPVSASSGYSGSRSTYTSSRLTSSTTSASSTSAAAAAAAATSSSTRPRFYRSRTLSDIDFDRASSPTYNSVSGVSGSIQSGFQSRFLGKVRQKSSAGQDVSRREKPFKSRFLRSSFDMGDSDHSSYTSTSVTERINGKTTSETTKDSGSSEQTSKD